VCFYDFIIRAACVVATCFPAALKLRLFVSSESCVRSFCVLCVVRPFFCGYYELFFFPIPRQRERVRESERERDGAHTHEHTHAQGQRNNDDDER